MKNPAYQVLYSKMGKIEKDIFQTLDEAVMDYKEKLRLDKMQVFDDRFVLGIEDADGNAVQIDQN